MDSIFVFLNGEQQGPYTQNHLRQLLVQNALQPDTLAWHEGLPEWVPLSALGLGVDASPVESFMVTQPEEGLRPVPQDAGFAVEIRELSVGQRLFDRYTLVRLIGRGGMGLVWLAKDEALGEEIALKFLPETVRLDVIAIEELKRETRRSRKLAHPNIVKVFDFVSDGNAAAISMEYINGDTLSGLRARKENLCFEVSEITPWTRQLLNAFSYAHEEARVVHRDLKPANVMVDHNGRAKVTDFGIASSIAENISRVTMQRGSSGTLAYMSPQQARGLAPSPQDDIYALGATLFELLTSKPPFYRGDIITQVWDSMPPTLSERRRELEIEDGTIPENWEQTIAACLAKKVENRPQSMAEVGMRLGLETALVPRIAMEPVPVPQMVAAQGAPTHLTVEAVPVQDRQLISPDGVRRRQRRMLVRAISALVVLIILISGYFYYNRVMVPAQKLGLAQQQIDQKAQDDEAKIAAGDSPEAAGYRAKAVAGDPAAECKLAELYWDGIGVHKNQSEALRWFAKAAAAGDAKAEDNLGHAYQVGSGLPVDLKKSFPLLQKSAQQGSLAGEFHLAEAYGGGLGTPTDYAQALTWLQKVANNPLSKDLGPSANERIGIMYAKGLGVSRDYNKAIEYFEKAGSFLEIGFMYRDGTGVPKNFDKAFDYFQKATAQGDIDGMKSLGDCYYNGWGVKQDYGQAMQWYEKADEHNGEGGAAVQIGIMYLNGVGVEKDYAQALKWFKQSGTDAGGLYELGMMYENGWGVPKDVEAAKKYYRQAAPNEARAEDALQRLGY